MRIFYASDLHIEFPQNYNYIYSELLKIKSNFNKDEDILLLLGDTFVIRNYSIKNNIFDLLSEMFKDVYILFGNHEFYDGYDISLIENEYFKKIRKNVYLVNNITFNYDNHKIILSTLFSNIRLENSLTVSKGMNDFYRIRYKKELLTVTQYNRLHRSNLQFVKDNIVDNCVIGTHYVPTTYVSEPRYKTSKIKDGFVTELFDLIYDNNIKYWLYGHNHYTNEKEINGTIIKSNQMGYYFSIDENFEFFKSLELK